jgi:hypothetical protein
LEKSELNTIILGKIFNKFHLSELKNVAHSRFESIKKIDRNEITLEDDIYTGTLDVIIDNKMGRAQMAIPKNCFSDNLVLFLDELGKKYNPNAEFASITFCRYAKEYGDPQLMPHIDHPSKIAFILDLQIESNVSWPICFENTSYVLNDEESILMESTKYPHWREPMLFKDGEYLDMMFMYFMDYTLEKNSEEEDPNIMNPIRAKYHEKRKIAGVPDYFSNYNPALEEKKSKNANI